MQCVINYFINAEGIYNYVIGPVKSDHVSANYTELYFC